MRDYEERLLQRTPEEIAAKLSLLAAFVPSIVQPELTPRAVEEVLSENRPETLLAPDIITSAIRTVKSRGTIENRAKAARVLLSVAAIPEMKNLENQELFSEVMTALSELEGPAFAPIRTHVLKMLVTPQHSEISCQDALRAIHEVINR